MKKTSIILYLFILVFIINCSKSDTLISHNYKRSFTITDYSNDSFYVQGKNYEIIFECDSFDLEQFQIEKEPFYVNIAFFEGEDDRTERFQLIKLKHLKDNKFIASIQIPIWASRFIVSVQNCKGERFIDWIEMPVTRQNGELPPGSIRCFFKEDKNGEFFKEYVRYEIDKNKNFLIFVTKWFYELKIHTMSKEKLNSDIDYIKAFCIDKSTRITLLTIGYFLKKDQKNFKKYLDSLLTFENLNEFNNDFVCTFFFQMFPYDTFDTLSFEPYLEKLLLSNPYSLLFDRCLSDGSFRKLPFSNLISCLNMRIKDKTNKYKEEFAKYIFFVEKEIVDSVRYYLPIIENYLNLLFHKNYLDIYPVFNNIIYQNKALLLTYLYQGYSLISEMQKGIEVLKKGITLFEPLDFNNYFFCKYIASSYEKLKVLDSALFYYLIAYKINPTEERLKQKIRNLTQLLNITVPNFDEWVVEKINHSKLVSSKIINPKIFIETTHAEKIFLKKPNSKYLILVFFNTNCGLCMNEINHINNHLNELLNSEVRVFIISNEPLELLDKFLKTRKINIPTVVNGNEIIRYFGIKLFPTTIIINSSGEICYYLCGYGEFVKNLILKLFQ